MGISDFLFALGKTINQLKEDKVKAKDCIRKLKYNMVHREDVLKKSIKANDALNRVYLDLPIEERRDYVQKTLDLFKYAPKQTTFSGGYISIMENLYDNAKYIYGEVKKEYNSKHYTECLSIYNTYMNDLEKTLIEIGVKEE